MFCKMGISWNKKLQQWLIVMGTVTAVLGIVLAINLPDGAGFSFGLFCGMLTGLGASSAVIGLIHLAKIRKMTPEELERKARQSNDERNQTIVGRAMRTTVLIVGTSAFAAAFVGALMNHVEITFTLIAVIYLILIVFVVACRHFEKTI